MGGSPCACGCWPGGESLALAEGHPHGRLVRWGEPPPGSDNDPITTGNPGK